MPHRSPSADLDRALDRAAAGPDADAVLLLDCSLLRMAAERPFAFRLIHDEGEGS